MTTTPVRFIVERGLFPDLDLEREYLRTTGVDVAFGELGSREAIARATREAHGLVLGTTPLPRELVEALGETVGVVGRPGVGLDNIDFDAARARGLAVIHFPDYCNEEVATHALAMVLALARRLPAAARIAGGEWAHWTEIRPAPPLSEQVIGIVGGGGRTGRLLASYMTGLAAEVLVLDPYVDRQVAGTWVGSLEEILERSDVVSLHIPLNAETRNLIGAAEIEQMRPGAAIVNVSRGGLIDEDALADALHRGWLSGAAVDVLATEPPPKQSPLLHAPNIIVTPHTAWYSSRSETRVRTDTVGAMLDYLRNDAPRAGRLAYDPRANGAADAVRPPG